MLPRAPLESGLWWVGWREGEGGKAEMSQTIAVARVKVNGSLDWGCNREKHVNEVVRRTS